MPGSHSLTAALTVNPTGAPLAAFGVHHALNPDPYRGRHGNDGAAYAADVADLIGSATSGHVAGFVHETVQGVGGAVPLADGYLPLVYDVSNAPDSHPFAPSVHHPLSPTCASLRMHTGASYQAAVPPTGPLHEPLFTRPRCSSVPDKRRGDAFRKSFLTLSCRW